MKYGKVTLGQIEGIINKLGGEEGALRLLRGEVEVVEKTHIIDCDVDPFVPKYWTVVEHTPGGQFRWDPNNVHLHLCYDQKDSLIVGHELRKMLKIKPVLNANVLDYLLANPHLIPEEWKDEWVFFWGTIYCGSIAGLYVRCLRWRGGAWIWHSRWLNTEFNVHNPAVVLASS